MSIGIAACESGERFFTNDQLWQTFLNTSFTGASGKVDVHSETGTREFEGLGYIVSNLVLDSDQSDDEKFHFATRTAIRVKFPDTVIEIGDPFSWSQYQKKAPTALPGFEKELNLITPTVRAAGLILGASVMSMCLGWVLFTFSFRKNTVILAAQPSFLYMMCAGVFIMISAVIPMSLQEPISKSGLDLACLSIPWLLSIGFVTSFSSMFCRTWRLNKVIDKARRFQRVKVEVKDVLLPFVILLVLNVIVLSVWSTIAPLEWVRIDLSNYDVFGRSRESYGKCASKDAAAEATFVTLLLIINLSAVVFSLYQSYLARNHPSQYNESYYVAIAMASKLEAILLGVPVLILLRDNPTASFLVRSILVAIICCAILLPMFVPKFRIRNTKRDLKRQVSILPFAPESGIDVSARGDFELNGIYTEGTSTLMPARRRLRDRGSVLFDAEQQQQLQNLLQDSENSSCLDDDQLSNNAESVKSKDSQSVLCITTEESKSEETVSNLSVIEEELRIRMGSSK